MAPAVARGRRRRPPAGGSAQLAWGDRPDKWDRGPGRHTACVLRFPLLQCLRHLDAPTRALSVVAPLARSRGGDCRVGVATTGRVRRPYGRGIATLRAGHPDLGGRPGRPVARQRWPTRDPWAIYRVRRRPEPRSSATDLPRSHFRGGTCSSYTGSCRMCSTAGSGRLSSSTAIGDLSWGWEPWSSRSRL